MNESLIQSPDNNNLHEQIELLYNHMQKSKSVFLPSNFWKDLNSLHLDQLLSSGFENFKRTINLRYFNWGALGIIANGLMAVAFRAFSNGFRIGKSDYPIPSNWTEIYHHRHPIQWLFFHALYKLPPLANEPKND